MSLHCNQIPLPSSSAAGAVFFATVLLGVPAARVVRSHPLSGPAAMQEKRPPAGHSAPAVRPELNPGTGEWYGVYLRTEKIGYASVVSHPATFHGHAAVRVDSQTIMRIKLLGSDLSEDIEETDFYTAAGSPLSTEFVMKSGGHENRVVATYTDRAVSYVVGDSAAVSLPVPAGVRLGSADDFSVNRTLLHTGAVWNEYYFDPATLAIEKFTGKVTGRQPRTPGGSKAVWLVDGTSAVGTVRMQVASDGAFIRAEMPLGIAMVRESRQTARMDADYRPSADLAELGAVVPTRPIERARDTDRLSILISGLADGEAPPSGPGQRVQPAGAGLWSVTVFRTPYPVSPAPFPEKPHGPSMAQALRSTPEISSLNPEMRAMAKSITAGAPDSAKAVVLLHDWVNQHMRARYDIGVIRSGMDVLHDRTGVCRDYAVLFASLARAAGIPTRICSGLVYWQGKFYYHAWDESFVGQWVRVDATMAQESADVTHITLARGDARSMYGAAAAVGRIKLDVRAAAYNGRG